MSINRNPLAGQAQACGAPHQADGPEGPMAPVETTDAATVDQRCSFKHWAGWRHNHSNSKLCVALRMGQANLFRIKNVVFAQGPCFLHVQISSNSICACHP